MILALPMEGQAQGLLGKVKDRAQSALNDKLEGSKMGSMLNQAKNKVNNVAESIGLSGNAGSEESEQSQMAEAAKVSGSDMIQKKRQRTSWYDSEGVTPSKSDKPAQLLNEFPAIPSAEELASPTQDKVDAFYRQIASVVMRAQQINDDSETTCDEQQTKEANKKIDKMIQDTFGLTAEEVAALNDENTPQEEIERITGKMLGINMGDLAKFEEMGNMSDEEVQKMLGQSATGGTDAMTEAVLKVYDKYPKEVKEYTGMNTSEIKNYVRSSYSNAMAAARQGKDTDPKMEAEAAKLEAKMKAYRKEQAAVKGKDWLKQAEAFDKKMEKEVQEASMAAMKSSSPFGSLIDMAQRQQSTNQNMEQKMQQMMERNAKYAINIDNLIPAASNKDAEFAKDEAKKINNLKKQIYADDANADALFAQASEAISTYRLRAAKVWREDLQRRVDAAKAELPGLIKNRREGIAEGVLPECALWRAPLNLVVAIGDLLEEAYSEFPCNYPSMYRKEVVQRVDISAKTSYVAELYSTATDLNSVLAGNCIFIQKDENNILRYNNGKWEKSNEKEMTSNTNKRAKSQTWTSQDGKRKVIYDARANALMLPEGDIIYPKAIEKQGNLIVWADMEQEDNVVKITKCTYKL